MQLGELRFRFLKSRQVRICVLPKIEKGLERLTRARGVLCQKGRPGQTEMGQRIKLPQYTRWPN